MSGPMAAGYGIETAVLVSAGAILDGINEIAADLKHADSLAEATRAHRQAERQQMREAREAGLEKRRAQAEARAARLRRLQDVLAAPVPTDEKAADLAALVAAGEAAQARLAEYLASTSQGASAAETAAARQRLVAGVIEHLSDTGDAGLPEVFAKLARDIVQAPTEARAAALITELRLQVQRRNDAQAEAAEAEKRQAAAALVLEQSLRDLGYDVEDIAETLFVEGGIAHFQRADWGDYFVRLRVDPRRQAMNFNVVRAGTAGEDRQHEDMLAEERWCAAFPKLFETLKARGIPISVTRLLQAGEAPVQVVDAATLPVRATEENRQESLKTRSIT